MLFEVSTYIGVEGNSYDDGFSVSAGRVVDSASRRLADEWLVNLTALDTLPPIVNDAPTRFGDPSELDDPERFSRITEEIEGEQVWQWRENQT